MSYYYSYYLGIKKSDGLIYPIGLFDESGKLYPVIERSRRFASDLHNDFCQMSVAMASNKLKEEFASMIADGAVKYLPISSLKSAEFVKTGYFLISDINQYESTHDHTRLFEYRLSPTTFAEMLRNNSRYPVDPKYSAEDFAYYAYCDTNSKEYETFLITSAFCSYFHKHYKDNYDDYVVIETEG